MAQSDYAIEVIDVKKNFKVYHDKGSSIKEKVLFKNRNHYEERWVLNGISFKVKKGEAIGLVGHNGCGKSTTLKLLTRIIYPDSGEIKVNGRVSSLLELGAGFHPDMSGRENIYINASIFGLSKKEIDQRIQTIIDFSELEEFLDNPVRTYSSGMYMRLAFSVAINVNADVLLVDEILGVGDVNFQAKCFEKMREIKASGTTIVVVSHSLPQIEQICDRSIWLEDGLIVDEGLPKYVHENYLAKMEDRRIERIEKEFEKAQSLNNQEAEEVDVNSEEENQTEDEKTEEVKKHSETGTEEQEAEISEAEIEEHKKVEKLPAFCGPHAVRFGNKQVEFTDIKLQNSEHKNVNVFKTGESMIINIAYKSDDTGLKSNFGVGIFRDDGVRCYGTNTQIENDTLIDIKPTGEIMIIIENSSLLPGKYMIEIACHSVDGIMYDDIRNICEFYVTSHKHDVGVCRLANSWYVDGEQIKNIKY